MAGVPGNRVISWSGTPGGDTLSERSPPDDGGHGERKVLAVGVVHAAVGYDRDARGLGEVGRF